MYWNMQYDINLKNNTNNKTLDNTSLTEIINSTTKIKNGMANLQSRLTGVEHKIGLFVDSANETKGHYTVEIKHDNEETFKIILHDIIQYLGMPDKIWGDAIIQGGVEKLEYGMEEYVHTEKSSFSPSS